MQCLLDCDEVFEGLGHLAPLNDEMTRMEKVGDPLVMAKASLHERLKNVFTTVCAHFLQGNP